MNIGTIRDGATHLPCLIDGDRAYRLDDLLGAMGGVPVAVPDGADAAEFWRRGNSPWRHAPHPKPFRT